MTDNKSILEKANQAITKGDYEGFLSHCTEDTEWVFVGEQKLSGKEAVRKYMSTAYKQPPKFSLLAVIAEGDMVTAVGNITLRNENNEEEDFAYCDVWTFREGKMAGLKAFVIKANL